MSNHPFSRILLVTEHSEFDVGAERVAFAMAKRCDLPLSGVLPVLSNPEFEVAAPQLAERAEKEAAEKIQAIRKLAAQAEVSLDMVARHGPERYREVVDEALRRDSDLIVLRRRGKKGFLARLLVGEMVSKIVGHAPCNVLFVPRACQMWSQGVVAAVDGFPTSAHTAEAAARVAAQCGIPLTLVSVLQHDTAESRGDAEALLQALAARATELGAKVTTVIRAGKPYEEIVAVAKQAGADLIAIGRHGDSGLVKAMLGGTAHKVIGLSEVPVLVVHA
jgi:nucleotide-binding universal stress UspA family protein